MRGGQGGEIHGRLIEAAQAGALAQVEPIVIVGPRNELRDPRRAAGEKEQGDVARSRNRQVSGRRPSGLKVIERDHVVRGRLAGYQNVAQKWTRRAQRARHRQAIVALECPSDSVCSSTRVIQHVADFVFAVLRQREYRG